MTPTDGPRLVWLDPLAAGAVFVIALALISGWPRNAVDATDRVAFAAPAAAILVAMGVAFSRRSRGGTTALAAALASGLCVAPVLWPTLTAREADRWSLASLTGVVVAIAIATAIAGRLATRIASDARGGPVLVALTLVGMSLAAPGLMAANHSISLAQRTVPLAVIAIVALAFQRRAAMGGVVAFVVAVLGAELVAAWHWSDLPGWQALTIVAAMPVAWAAFELPIVPRRLRGLRVALALLLAAGPAIAAGVVAGVAAQRESTSTGGGDEASYYGGQ